MLQGRFERLANRGRDPVIVLTYRCRTCLFGWIEREESSGRITGPTRPFCRSVIGDEDIITETLGLPYRPRELGARIDDEIEEFMLHYINEYTVPCANCGYRIEKGDGNELIYCLCGYRFCCKCDKAPRRNAVATTHTANALCVTTLQMMEKNDVGAKEGNIETPEKKTTQPEARQKKKRFKNIVAIGGPAPCSELLLTWSKDKSFFSQ